MPYTIGLCIFGACAIAKPLKNSKKSTKRLKYMDKITENHLVYFPGVGAATSIGGNYNFN